MDLPPIPATVHSMLGPIPVLILPDLGEMDDHKVFGLWVPEERCIKLLDGMHPLTTFVTLWHERVHVACWDAGIALSHEDEERVADALSTFIVADLLSCPNGTMRGQ
jgi:hypothetical protein